MSAQGQTERSGELLVGGVVLAVAAAFLLFAFLRAGAGPGSGGGYTVAALFDRVDGVAVGADVRMAGVKVGSVSAVTLDTKTYQAKLDLSLARQVTVPADSTARIATDGLLGGAYVALEPGADPAPLKPGGEIVFTQGSVDLITLLASAASGGGNQGGGDQ